MRYESLYVAGAASWLPPTVALKDAAEAGWISPKRVAELQYESVTVADGPESAPEMAVLAGRSALDRSGASPQDVGLVVHASVNYQGIPWWPVASYVARHAVGPDVPGFELLQRCNGGMGAFEAAANYLAGGASRGTAALVTTGDRFDSPHVDRWNVQDITIYGDGGSGLVLSSRGGFARVLSVVSHADNRLEAASRGDTPFGTPLDAPVDYQQRYKEWVVDAGLETHETLITLLSRVRDEVLADAGITRADLARVVVSGTGRSKLHMLFGVTEEQTNWDFIQHVGHVGPGDFAASLAYLVETRGFAAGDHVLLFGGGGGYTCTAAVLEILTVPTWEPTAPWLR